jgi:hypothetical protein
MMLRERGRSAPRYFVEEVMSGVDETDLYRTWVPVSPTTTAAVFSCCVFDFVFLA